MDLLDVRGHDYAGRHQRIALFERNGMRFSLVPAARAALGYDGTRFVPTPQQTASYAESADEYGLPAITEFIDSMTSPQRAVGLPALLVAVEALDTCVTTAAADDPRVQNLMTGARPGGGAMTFGPDGNVKVEFDEAGQVRSARVVEQITYDDALAEAAPTSGKALAAFPVRQGLPCDGRLTQPAASALPARTPEPAIRRPLHSHRSRSLHSHRS